MTNIDSQRIREIRDNTRAMADAFGRIADTLADALELYISTQTKTQKSNLSFEKANEPQIEPNLILRERMERGEMYEVGDSIVVMNSEDYYDLLCKSWEKDEPQTDCSWK